MLLYRHLPMISMGAAAVLGYSTTHKDTLGLYAHRIKLSAFKEQERPFDGSTQKIVDELIDYALDTLDRTPEEIARTTFFWSNQKDTTHFGGFFTRFGTCIGVPTTFALRSKSDIDLLSLKLGGMVIPTEADDDIDKEALEQLSEALMLSEDAKRFALATELQTINSWYLWVKLQYLGCMLGFFYSGLFLAPYTTPRNPLVQVAVLVFLLIAWQRVYYISQGMYTVQRTIKSDKEAAEIGPGYLDGGLEYITKLQLRNQALRRLQKNGEQLYTDKGETIKSFFEMPSASLAARRKLLEEVKQERLRKAELEKETEDVLETIPEVEQVPVMQEATDPPTNGESENQETNAGYFGWLWRIFG